MIGISFWRVLRAAGQNFWRNIWLSLATTAIMVMTLLMISFLYFANVFGNEVLENIQKKVDLSVNFKPEVTMEYVTSLAAEIESREDVESTRIVSREEALRNFRELHKDDGLVEESLGELEDNPLSDSMNIVATDPRFYKDIAKQLQSEKYSQFIEKVNYEDSRLVIDKLINIIGTTKQVSLFVTLGFAVLAALIMFNTVRLAIYSFREEIDIMRLVGASRWFIQGPFLIESVLVALIAIGISTTILYIALQGISNPMERFFFDQSGEQFNIYTYATRNWLKIIGLQILTGVGLAVVSSFIGIRRYLRD